MVQQLARLCRAGRAAFAATACAALFAAAVALAESNAAVTAPVTSNSGGPSFSLRFDRNGRYAVFTSFAENLVPGQQSIPGQTNAFLYDRLTAEVTLISHAADDPLRGANVGVCSTQAPQISADGKWVAFCSASTDLIEGQDDNLGSDDIFLWSRETGDLLLASHRATSPTGSGLSPSALPVFQSSLSADGRYLAFVSTAPNLIAGQVINNHAQIYVFDRVSGVVRLVSHASTGVLNSAGNRSDLTANSGGSAISADGRFLVFISLATDLVAGVTDTNGNFDVYLWDRDASLASSLRLLSRRAGAPLETGNAVSTVPAISADGKFVTFTSNASNLEGISSDTNNNSDVFRYDRVNDQVQLVSHRATGATTVTANAASNFPVISAAGDQVAFESTASNLAVQQDDSNGVQDVFVWRNGASFLVSHRPDLTNRAGNGTSRRPRIGQEGGVAFTSLATDLAAGVSDANSAEDAFLLPRGAGEVLLLSHVSSELATGDRQALSSEVLMGGALATFESAARNLIDTPINGGNNLYFHGTLLMADGFESGDFSAWSQQVP